MKKLRRSLWLVAAALHLGGCAGTQGALTILGLRLGRSPERADAALLENYRSRAARYEATGEIRKAILMWEVLSALVPSDRPISARVMQLKRQSRSLAQDHYEKAIAYFSRGESLEARKEFILALYYDPEKHEALQYLKEEIPGQGIRLYTTRSGDTLAGIADRVYGDPGKAFVIGYYNDLDEKSGLSPGMVLRVPEIDLHEIPQPPIKSEGSATRILEKE